MVSVVGRVKRLAHRMFQACGYDFLRYTADNFASLRRAKIVQTQNIALVLDVGAYEGTYALQLRQSGYSGRITSFEPLSQTFSILQQRAASDPLWSCENLAIGDSDGMIEMNISGHTSSSSILPISEAHLKAMPSSATVSKEKVKIARLDSLLGKMFERNRNTYVKIDVQGFEKHVLAGARETLRQTRAIELELSLVPVYQGAALLDEMLDWLTQHDFIMVSIEHVFSDVRTGNMLQADGIFVKQEEAAGGGAPAKVLKELKR